MKFPDKCPACGAGVHTHRPETTNDYEYVEFDCRCTLLMIDGRLDVEVVCGDATRNAVDKLNVAAR